MALGRPAFPAFLPLPWPPAPPTRHAAGAGGRATGRGRRPAIEALRGTTARGWWREALVGGLAHGALLAAALILMVPAIAQGAIRWQDDTKYFYYPLLANLAAALKAGRLPLWEPGIFGGYPLFADGESGMLYPLHLLALRWLAPPQALVALRLVRFHLAGAFTYAFLRAVGAGRTGALVGGLTFMLSGFMVGQVVHENLHSGMVWLPLVLYFVERAVRAGSARRYLLAAFAGVALAMQALAVHVQVCVLSALAAVPYLGWRVLAPGPDAGLPSRLVGRVFAGAGMAAVLALAATGLAAVQVLPLLDIAGRSARGHGISLAAATINSVTPFRLLTIVFPDLLRRPDGSSFGYWVDWEVTVYVGVPALFLAAAAVALRRDRYALFFAALAGLALALSMGRYGPPWVVLVTQDLLGDHGLRSPGRFAFLWSFGVAVLAGLGVDWLDRRPAGTGANRGLDISRPPGRPAGLHPGGQARGERALERRSTPANLGARNYDQAAPNPLAPFPLRDGGTLAAAKDPRVCSCTVQPRSIEGERARTGQRIPGGGCSPLFPCGGDPRSGRRGQGVRSAFLATASLLSRFWLLAVAVLLAGVAAGCLLALRAAHGWLMRHPEAARAWLEQRYVAFDRSVRLQVSADDVYRHVAAALDPANPFTAAWVLSVVAGYGLLVAWLVAGARPSAAWRGRAVVRTALRALTPAVVTLPLLATGTRAHPAAAVAALEPDSGAARYLRAHLAPPAGPSGPERSRPLYRVYTAQAVYLYRFDVEPNALLPLGIEEAGGYSSLSTEANLAYSWAAETSGGGRMLDVWNARYYLWPNKPEALPSHELTSFHPQRPLVAGSGANAGAAATFRVPAVGGENIRVVATLRDAWTAPAGAVAGWITATDESGAEYRWPLRVGGELAEATAAASAPLPDGHWPLPVFSWLEYGAGGQTSAVRLYYAKLPLPEPRTIVRLAVQAAVIPNAPHAILRVYGLGVGQPDWSVHSVFWYDRERFTRVYADEEVQVYRNEQVLPRAYLVPLAVRAPRAAHLKQMAERAFDPERMLLLDAAPGTLLEGPAEDLGAGSWFIPPTGESPGSVHAGGLIRAADATGRVSTSPAGTVAVTQYSADRVALAVDATSDSWLFLADTFDPSWHVYVDGAPRPLRLANALFRAVAVTAGQHAVELRYEPAPLQRGAAISLLTGLALLALCAAGAAASLVARCRGRAAYPLGSDS